jgi:hypothetical protein
MHGGTHDWRTHPTCHVTGPLILCEHGIHLCRRDDLIHWLGPVICPVTDYDAEGMLIAEDKVVARSATIGAPLTTWNETTARLLACDVAERAVRLYWTHQADTRPFDAIRVARRYAYGLATDTERDAAGDAAMDAAWDAAAAARDAAWDAAAAARAAAWDAAMAARAAAGDAAMAARDAAWDAARAAAWAGCTRRLWEYLDGIVTPESLRPTYEAHNWSDPLA